MAANKLKNYRLPPDILRALDEAERDLGLAETEIVKRSLRYFLRQLKKDRNLIVSRDASEELQESPVVA